MKAPQDQSARADIGAARRAFAVNPIGLIGMALSLAALASILDDRFPGAPLLATLALITSMTSTALDRSRSSLAISISGTLISVLALTLWVASA